MTTTHSRPWWLGLAVMALGGVCLYSAAQLPATAQYASIGPGMALMGVGGGLRILGVLLLVQVAQGVAFEPDDAENVDASRPMDRRAFVTALVAIALPALLLRTLGLPLTAMLSFMFVARALGSRRVGMDLLIGLLLGSAGWWLFGSLGLQLGDFLPLMGKRG